MPMIGPERMALRAQNAQVAGLVRAQLARFYVVNVTHVEGDILLPRAVFFMRPRWTLAAPAVTQPYLAARVAPDF
jgi:hypothetical protein